MLSDDIVGKIDAAIAGETALPIARGVLSERPDRFAVIVRLRLSIAFGSSAVQQLSRELKEMGER